jgi:carboxylesterase type B
MQDYWVHFARKGNPNLPGAPAWTRFNNSAGAVQELTPTGIGPSNSFTTFHKCGFWTQLETGG